jgi:phage tail-like protein
MAVQLTSPITAKPTQRDPLRNFKFSVKFFANNSSEQLFANMGFMSVSGIGIQTDMIPYREGGDNTIVRKMPGQSDVSPLTLVGGVFADNTKNDQYEWFKKIFAVQWGSGSLGPEDDFRATMVVRVLQHPITRFAGGAAGGGDPKFAGAAFKFFNCWPASVVFNDLNSGDNSLLVSNMTVHHEGFKAYFGNNAKGILP